MADYKITLLKGDGIGPEIVNQAVKVLDCAAEKFGFGNGILAAKPQILFGIQCVVKAASCKAFNGFVKVVNALDHTRSVKVMDQLASLLAICSFKYQHGISWLVDVHFCVLVNITVSVTCNGNWLLPVLDAWLNALYHDGCTENSSV